MDRNNKELLLITLEQLNAKLSTDISKFTADVSYRDKIINFETDDQSVTLIKNINTFTCKLEKKNTYTRNKLEIEMPHVLYLFSKEYRLFNKLFKKIYKYTINKKRIEKSSSYAKAICNMFPDILEEHLLPEDVQRSMKNKS